MARFTILRVLLVANIALFASAAVLPRAPQQGTQFITGVCARDTDCASDCCGFNTGKCAGAVIAQQRDGGCGFSEPAPNNRAAQVIQGPNALAAPGVVNGAAPPPPAAAPAPPAPAPGVTPNNGSGKPPGTQFITGVCASDSECASDCCAFTTGKCAGAVIAQQRDGGCGFGDAAPNNRAAQVIQGPNALAAPGVLNVGAPAPAPAPAAPAPAAGGSGKPPGTQFITGVCGSDGDCASGCCGFTSGKCAGAIIAQERDGGCGFGDAQPNANAAQRITARHVFIR